MMYAKSQATLCCLQVRQNYGVTIDRAFKPTSNARLAATFGETKRFADALRKFDKQCSAHLQGVKGVASPPPLTLSQLDSSVAVWVQQIDAWLTHGVFRALSCSLVHNLVCVGQIQGAAKGSWVH